MESLLGLSRSTISHQAITATFVVKFGEVIGSSSPNSREFMRDSGRGNSVVTWVGIKGRSMPTKYRIIRL